MSVTNAGERVLLASRTQRHQNFFGARRQIAHINRRRPEAFFNQPAGGNDHILTGDPDDLTTLSTVLGPVSPTVHTWP